MFHYTEILHAKRVTPNDGPHRRLAAYDCNEMDILTMDLSDESLRALINYAGHSFEALGREEQEKFIDPNEKNPHTRLSQKVHYLAHIAPDFLEQTGAPFIIDMIPSDKKQESKRIMGFVNEEGLYSRTESESPQKSLMSIFKMAFKKDFRELTTAAKADLRNVSENPDVYEKRVKAFLAKNNMQPDGKPVSQDLGM